MRSTFFNVTFYSVISFLSLISVSQANTLFSEDTTAEEAREILHKMSEARQSLNYDGVFVYSRGSQLQSMRIIHKVDESGEVEKLISLTGANREVVRENDDVTCIFSDNKTVLVDKGEDKTEQFLPTKLPQSIDAISQYYYFSVIGSDRAAGRDATVILIAPKDEHRYAYKMWIDKEHYLVLKSTIEDLQEHTLETVMFTQIEIGHEIPADLLTPMNATDYNWFTNESHHSPEEKVVENTGWDVRWLPAGFSMHDADLQAMSSDRQPVEHLVYSDGLATVSLFIEKLVDGKQPMNGFLTRGAVNAFTTSNQEYQITAVGEVPAKTVHKIAMSVTQGN